VKKQKIKKKQFFGAFVALWQKENGNSILFLTKLGRPKIFYRCF